ncbi:MAG: hypothetical protein ACAH59_08960, partial [Pseudobdellovibrionaceae bacterium]
MQCGCWLTSGINMEVRRFNNILGFKSKAGPIIGFHASNLEIAEISEELWQTIVDQNFDQEAANQMKDWDLETYENSIGQSQTPKIRSLSINVTQLCNLQ